MAYTRKILFENPQFEMVRCDWNQGDRSEMHGHGFSQCFALVENGIFENVTLTEGHRKTELVETGQVLWTPLGSQHEIRCVSDQGRTLHVYSPKVSESPQKKFRAPEIAPLRDLLVLNSAPAGIEKLMESLVQIESQSISTNGPYFMNQLFSGVFPETVLAEQLIARKKTTLATFEASPVFTMMEAEVIQNLGNLIGWKLTDGVSVPGGSAANFMALHCARERKFPKAKTEGLSGQKPEIFISDQAHYSFQKAALVLGFGSDQVVQVKSDSHGRMISGDLDLKINQVQERGETPLIVCATSGTTVFGSFDPLSEIAEVCEKHNIWLHVDGAWGGPVLFSKTARALVAGIQKADSVTFDAHKLLGAGLTCSFFLTKNPTILRSANDVSGAEYLFHDEVNIDSGKLSWQCGRRADVVSFWSIWKSKGSQGLGEFVDRMLELRTKTVVRIAQHPRLRLLHDPEYLNICVQVLPPKGGGDAKTWSKKVREKMRDQDLAMVNYSTDKDGTTFLRMILANPELDIGHIEQILNWSLEVC